MLLRYLLFTLLIAFINIGALPASPWIQQPTNTLFWQIPINQLTADQIWQRTYAHILLKPNLKQSFAAYQLSHKLMLPMIASFQLHKIDHIKQFDIFFNKALLFYHQHPFQQLDNYGASINQVSFLLLASMYLAENKKYHHSINKNLLEFVVKNTNNLWSKPAWIWTECNNGEKIIYHGNHYYVFKHGLKTRMAWKLSHPNSKPSYCHAIFDDEIMLFAVAANLKEVYQDQAPPNINDILNLAHLTFEKIIVPTDNQNIAQGWLLQPGAWLDHPSFALAKKLGVNEPDTLNPRYVYDISHSMRLAVIIKVFADLPGKYQHFYRRAQNGLLVQFVGNIHPPNNKYPFYTLNNYLDNTNGVYRPGSRIYLPFALSASLYNGWWALLVDQQNYQLPAAKKLHIIYKNIIKLFPLSAESIQFLANQSAQVNIYFDGKDSTNLILQNAPWENGIFLLIIKNAEKLTTGAHRLK